VVAVAGIVLGFLLLRGGDDPGTTPLPPTAAGTQPTPQATPAPGTPPQQTGSAPSSPELVNFQITNALASDIEIGDRVVVYSDGQEVGVLEVSTTSTYAVLNVSAPPGENNYELEMDIWFTDGTEATLGGRGTLNAYEGATYAVAFTPSGSGYEVTLREVQ